MLTDWLDKADWLLIKLTDLRTLFTTRTHPSSKKIIGTGKGVGLTEQTSVDNIFAIGVRERECDSVRERARECVRESVCVCVHPRHFRHRGAPQIPTLNLLLLC